MRPFLDAVRASLDKENYFGALTSALILPDICGSLETPTAKPGPRYISWCERYVAPLYTTEAFHAGGDGGVFVPAYTQLSGADCWALRNAVLHAGVDIAPEERTGKGVERFVFCIPGENGNSVHANLRDTVLQLSIDVFSRDICVAVDKWLSDVEGNDAIQTRIVSAMRLYTTA